MKHHIGIILVLILIIGCTWSEDKVSEQDELIGKRVTFNSDMLYIKGLSEQVSTSERVQEVDKMILSADTIYSLDPIMFEDGKVWSGYAPKTVTITEVFTKVPKGVYLHGPIDFAIVVDDNGTEYVINKRMFEPHISTISENEDKNSSNKIKTIKD